MESVAKGDSKLSPSAAAKKLKQTRLPFQILSGSPAASPEPVKTTPTRKRKPSIEADSNRATKIGRISEAKENVKDSVSEVVVLDDESVEAPVVNDSAAVETREDDLSKTPTRKGKAGESSGESASKEKDDKIKIKFPIGKRKGRKNSGGDEGSAKKKVPKEKKKQRKANKKTKGNDQEVQPVEETIALDDDDDLSDVEKEVEKGEVKVEEASVDMKEDATVETTEVLEEKNQEQPAGVVESEEASAQKTADEGKGPSEAEVEIVESTSTETEKIVENISAEVKPDEETVEPKTKVEDESPSEADVEIVESTPSETDKVVENSSAEVKPDEGPVESKKKVEDEAVTPRRSRRAASQKTSEPEPKKDEETPKRGRSAKKQAADKKSESKTPKGKKSAEGDSSDTKAKSEPEAKKETTEKVSKPTTGALDKMFAKIQTENKKKPVEPIQVLKTPEKKSPKSTEAEAMEVDQPEPTSATTAAAASNPVISICLDESNDGGANDDEENAYMLCTPNSKERSLVAAETNPDKKLTPKQLARRKEAEQRLAAKQQELEEKKRKKQEEKEAKQREKEEQELLKKKEREEKEEQKRKEREEKEEQKRKEKEEKEEQKRLEREDKERKRLAEQEAKNEEKRKKEEQKEEERKKKEEEKEAEEKRKQKTAQAFQSFFVKKPVSKEVKQSDDENSMDRQSVGDGGDAVPRLAFMPFCVKGDMRLAPVCRVFLEVDRKKRLEAVLAGEGSEKKEGLYLQQLKSRDYVVGKYERTVTAQDDEGDEDDVMIVDDNVCHQIEVDPSAAPARRYRAKFFLFEENRRPPYRGTWRKRSTQIQARRPFVQDTKFFDYEVDSDDEWEEEEPGESLHGSDDEKDVDPEEDYEVDNDFFVPHGHLSDEEMQAEDDVMEDNSPETQKAKLKILQQEFAAEMKKKTEKIKPRLIGCLWENGPGEGPECSAVIWEILKARAMLFDPEEPISFTVQKAEPESNSSSPSKDKELIERRPKQVKLVDEGVKELITLIHGSAQGRKFLIKEFLAYWAKRRDEGESNVPQYGQDSIKTKILEVASWRPCPDEGPMQNKMCWYVNKEALVKYGLTDLKIPTGWEFILKPITKSRKERKPKKDEEANGEDEGGEKKSESKKESPKDKEKNDRLQSTPSLASKSKPATPRSNITKFTKKLSEDDKRKQFAKQQNASTASPSNAKNKKSATTTTTATSPAVAASPSSDSPKPAAAKKRVQLLMSVPRGQSINQTTKSNLISQFLAKAGTTTSSSSSSSDSSKDKKTAPAEAMEVDPPVANGNHGGQATEPGEVIVLDD